MAALFSFSGREHAAPHRQRSIKEPCWTFCSERDYESLARRSSSGLVTSSTTMRFNSDGAQVIPDLIAAMNTALLQEFPL